MKRYFAAAGALLLGTSALAMAAGADTMAKDPALAAKPVAAKTDPALSAKPIAAKTDPALAAKLEPTLGDKAQMQLAKLEKTSADRDAKVQTASIDTFDKSEAKLQTASADPVDKQAGMGGPIEEADLTPRLADQNYPPCDPGPGDDRCIQLYEPGVRAQLASWNHPTGGLADGSATTAMGGPYEPVADDKAETASASTDAHAAAMGGPYEPVDATSDASAAAGMNGDGVVDPALGETDDLDVVGHSEFRGVGGPVEAQSGYPPCDPGPGDDRCIQLYERGVTGAGN